MLVEHADKGISQVITSQKMVLNFNIGILKISLACNNTRCVAGSYISWTSIQRLSTKALPDHITKGSIRQQEIKYVKCS